MMMAQNASACKIAALLESISQLFRFVQEAAEAGKPVHEVELGLWQRLLALGRQALEQFLAGITMLAMGMNKRFNNTTHATTRHGRVVLSRIPVQSTCDTNHAASKINMPTNATTICSGKTAAR